MILVEPVPVYQVNDDDDERYDDDKKRRHAKPDNFLFWISVESQMRASSKVVVSPKYPTINFLAQFLLFLNGHHYCHHHMISMALIVSKGSSRGACLLLLAEQGP